MAKLWTPFNAAEHNPEQRSGGILPIGKYPVIIESSEVLENKNKDGGFLALTLRITDGPNAGGGGIYRLNLYHANAQTMEIANKQLSAICHVTGMFIQDDTSPLHGIPFVIEVGAQANDEKYTEVKKVFDINGNEPGKAPAVQNSVQTSGFNAQHQHAQQQPSPTAAPAPTWHQQAPPAQAQQAAPQTAPANAFGPRGSAPGAPAVGGMPWKR